MVTCENTRFLTEKIILPYKPARDLARWLEYIKAGHRVSEGCPHGSRRPSTVAMLIAAAPPGAFNYTYLDQYRYDRHPFALRSGLSRTEVGYRTAPVATSHRPVLLQS